LRIINQGTLKANIETALSKPEEKILTDDVKTLLYSTMLGDDIGLVLKAIQKYETQSSDLGPLKFNFEVPLMKLFYVQNETAKALELFMSNVISFYF
jgi:hypothetical protein